MGGGARDVVRWAFLLAALGIAVGVALWLVQGSSRGGDQGAVPPSRPRRPGGAGAASVVPHRPPPPVGRGPGHPTEPAGDGRVPKVRGRVVDPDGNPVSGGTLTALCLRDDGGVRALPGGNAAVAEDGRFELAGCEGTVCLDLHHAGFVRDGPWAVEAGRGPVELHARPLSRLEGRVVDPAGDPVPGADVVALAGPGEDPHALPPFTATRTTTDADGTFRLARVERAACDPCRAAQGRCHDAPLPTWVEVRLTAWAAGLPPAEGVVEDFDEPVELRLPPAGPPIQGRVEGRLPSGAYVLARSEARPYEVRRADLDPAGRFEIRGVGEGSYELRLLAGRRQLARRSGVGAGQSLRLRLEGGPGRGESGGSDGP